ncbi:MAG: glycoside hydrolase family 127 protein, partial [Kiritimatiellae bacterium]|nr:glycoside hydrolase family 127 protein [Kiritimatiellia bacterium]
LNLVHAGEILVTQTAKRAKFKGCKWSDAYPYNIVEAASLALELDAGDDAELKAGQDFLRQKIDAWIPIILSAQEESGYIDSYTLLNELPHFQLEGDHEFYVMGYFIEMGIAHHRATGDRRLFEAAIKCADHLDSVFGPEPKRTWMNGHPGLEYALCRLADATGDEKYARLAQHFVRNQHTQKNKRDYNQAERPAVEMSEAKGHAVRANYFYAAMAGVANRLDDKPLGDAAARLFDSIVDRKYYLTGGVGDDYKKEAYGRDYALPQKAYAESCAGCGLEFFARESRQLVGSDKAEAVRERVVFNNILGAISRDGTRFYYQNPLSSDMPRYAWHGCPCCVGNIPRTLLALKDTVFSVEGDTLFINQYMDIENAKVTVGGVSYTVSMKTDYPGDGRVMLCASFPAGIKVFGRFPNRAESALYKAEPEVEHGYKGIGERGTADAKAMAVEPGNGERNYVWELPLPEQTVVADGRVESCRGKVAFQKGPIVYSMENGKKVPNYDRLNEGGFSEVWTTNECSITVSDRVRFPVAPDLWGIFFEDIDLSLDGGIYAEMVRNRSFEDGKLGREQNEPLAWWDPVGAAYLSADVSKPLSPRNRRCVRVEARPGAGIANQGYFGMNVEKGKRYNLSVALRGEAEGPIEVSFEAYGKAGVLGRALTGALTSEWKTHELSIEATDSDPRARFVFRAPKGGVLFMDCVSLFPAETYGKSGLFRKDLMEKLAALKPSFVRFPGGCWVEGDTMKDAYRWKTTLGSIWERRTQWNIWKYWSTNGVGFHEYLLLCEELGAKPLFCINCGIAHKDNTPMEKMDEFVQDALDCIEYCNGSADTKWGAVRAEMGHPEPFNLEYLEIGNENYGQGYTDRYKLIAEAVRAKHPEIKLIFNYFRRWNVAEGPRDIRDDHYYNSPDWFMANASLYADCRKFPRDGFKIFVGEYAVTRATRPYGSLRAAIGEAMFMVGLENAQDVVSLAAYAPLFANAQHLAWSPNLINVVSDGCFTSPSWNVQRLFSEYRGKEVLDCRVDAPEFEPGEKNRDGTPMKAPSIAASAVRGVAGEIILKVVNPTEHIVPARLDLKGRARLIRFTGPGADACNSLYDREALKETEDEIVLDGRIDLPPLSLNVYVVQAEEPKSEK